MTINQFIDAFDRMILGPLVSNKMQGFLLSNNMRFYWNDARLTKESLIKLKKIKGKRKNDQDR
jgi:hypothetical protein|tara:strand:+ start:272 stop:460 length:189 start_codon:yes stop_codon:yes gene_type:complete